jgi:15-cis-phytoene synthase
MIANGELEESSRYCRELTRRQARNFYFGLKLLAEPKRSGMFALYAYMRCLDDIADGQNGGGHAQRLKDLDRWQDLTRQALFGQKPDSDHPVWVAFTETVRRHNIPAMIFDEVIAGQRQDLQGISFQAFDELRQYCYRVAGVVGLACVHIFGFDGAAATETMAVDRGLAFQLTNILRDLAEDTARGRMYLPQKELADAGLTTTDFAGAAATDKFIPFMHKQIERAQSYYECSAGLEDHIEPDARPTLVAMTQIYRGLLRKVARQPANVLRHRVSLSLPSKLLIGWRALRAG